MKMEDKEVYMIINNIPKHFHAYDLRAFFSFFIESGGFSCFHYRHRPEVQKSSESEESDKSEKSRRVTCCCIIKVLSDRAADFFKSYNGEHWFGKKGGVLTTKCFIKKLSLIKGPSQIPEASGKCKKGTVLKSLPLEQESFSHEDLDTLIEMHPPTFMPNGNVGTKTSHFLEEIKACRLPPSIITKLGLEFSRNRSRRIYGTVPFDYLNRRNNSKDPSTYKSVHPRGKWREKPLSEKEEKSEDTETDEEEEEEEEEWDRHEALHNDVTSQERSKERLFEEEIELKWEKGGSGLVFYTDAQFWDEKEGDFDAKTADDWDIDMNVYKDPGGTDYDKDSRDMLRMRLEQAVRNGTDTETDRRFEFAAFDKYSKGFARKLMESQGWKQGLGIGKNYAGMAEPLSNDGQKPFDKKGFGYRGEKLNRKPTKPHRKRRNSNDEDVFRISTIYDNPKESDPPDSAFICTSYSKLKYRREFLKEKGCDS